ncbi:MAG: hypothetical protein Q8O67_05505 [Deltaproteobacteria bacterium]|nr:hypothetical protein [Deltaproteobacteria bacterium]
MLRRLRLLLLSLSLVVALVGSCASYTVVPEAARAAIDEEHAGELLYLKQSMYAGRFYDDDRFRLLHPRRFEELTYLLTAEGDPIAPPPAEEIIPAGTRVRVEKIEWPDGDAVFRRPLYTPRYTTWVFLRVARERGSETTIERSERHILLLPAGIGDQETFNQWFTASLSTEDNNPALLALPEAQQHGVEQKKPTAGMSYDTLTSALGFPDRLAREERDGHTVEVAVYGATSVVLKDGVVDRFSAP